MGKKGRRLERGTPESLAAESPRSGRRVGTTFCPVHLGVGSVVLYLATLLAGDSFWIWGTVGGKHGHCRGTPQCCAEFAGCRQAGRWLPGPTGPSHSQTRSCLLDLEVT